MQLEITAYGDVLIRRDLLRFADNLAVPVLALKAITRELRAATKRQFDTEGGNSGGWQALAASTLAEKTRKGYPDKILQATGALMASLVDENDPAHIERLSADSVAFGSTMGYGIFHATGTYKMVKRPPVALTEMDKVRLVKEVQAALVADVRAASGRVW